MHYFRIHILLVAALAILASCGGGKKVSKDERDAFGRTLGITEDLKRQHLQRNFLDGKKEMYRGNWDKAREYFEKCLMIDDEYTPSIYELARIDQQQKQYQDGLERMKKAVRLSPENKWYQILLAQLHESTGRYDESAKIYQALSEANPKKVDYLYDWANAVLRMGEYQQAIELYDRIEQGIGLSEDISVQKYRLYLKMNQADKAVAEINKLIENSPAEARYYGMLAELYKSQGQEDKALQTYEELLKIDPDNPFIQLSLAEYYKDAGESEKAEAAMKKAFSNSELSIDTKIQVLVVYFDLSARDPSVKAEALELNKILIDTHPEDPKGYAMYGDFLLREQRLEEAREAFRKATALDNSKFLVWQQLLFIESDLNDYGAMVEESQTAMDLFPSQPLFYFFNGAGNLRKKNYEKAIEVLEEGLPLVVANDPLKSQFHASLGDAYNHEKMYAESDLNYDQALKLDPQNFYVLNNYSYYLSLRGEKLEQAEEMSRICVELQPNSASYLDTYGWVLYKLERYVDARDWLQRAMDRGGKNSGVILEHFGDVMYKLDDRKEALKYWEKAREAGGASDKLEEKIKSGELLE